MKQFLLVLILCITSNYVYCESSPVKAQHIYPVVSIDILPNGDSLLSVDSSGIYNIWSITEKKIISTGYLGLANVRKVIINPNKNGFSVLGKNFDNDFIISYFDLELNKRTFVSKLNDEPLFWCLTAGGNYIISTFLSAPQILVWECSTGKIQTKLNQIDVPFPYIYVGSTEKQFFAYQSTGNFVYGDFLVSKPTFSKLPVEKNLTQLFISSDKKYIISAQENRLLAFDRTNGKLKSFAAFGSNITLSQDPFSDEFIVSEKKSEYEHVFIYKLLNDKFEKIADLIPKFPRKIQSISYCHRHLLIGYKTGEISMFTNNIEELLSQKIIFKTISIVNSGSKVYFLSESSLLIGKSNFWLNPDENLVNLKLPSLGIGHLVRNSDTEDIYFYNSEKSDSIIYKLEKDTWVPLTKIEDSLKKVLFQNDSLIMLETSGHVKVFNLKTKTITFEITNSIFLDITTGNGSEIIFAGQESTLGSVGSIDWKTGKSTIFVRKDYVGKKVDFDKNNNLIWFLGSHISDTNINELFLVKTELSKDLLSRWTTKEFPEVFFEKDGLILSSSEGLYSFSSDGDRKIFDDFSMPLIYSASNDGLVYFCGLDGRIVLFDIKNWLYLGTLVIYQPKDWLFYNPGNNIISKNQNK